MRAELSATQYQLFRVLVRIAGDAALGGHAGFAHRMASTVAAAFTTTQRMVDRVHRLGTGVRANAAVAVAPGLAETDVDPVQVGELSDRRPAGAADTPHFARRQDNDRPLAFFRAQTSDAAGAAHQLAALPRVHLDIVNFQAGRHVRQRHRVADLGRGIDPAHHRRAHPQAVGAEDVRLGPIRVLDQRDEGRAVRVILDRLDARLDAVLKPLEVDDAIQLLIAAAAVLCGDY